MKTKNISLLLVLASLSATSALADPTGKFGYESVDENGVLVSVNNVYYEVDGVKYPVDDAPAKENLCAAFGFAFDLGLDSGVYTLRTIPKQKVLGNWSTGTLLDGTEAISSLICGLQKGHYAPSTHYQSKVVNPDGTVTFIEPRFVLNGKEIGIASDYGSSRDGCMFFAMEGIPADHTSEYFTGEYYSPKPSEKVFSFLPIQFDGDKLYHQSDVYSTGLYDHHYASVTCKPPATK
jgi:hypothetical protein